MKCELCRRRRASIHWTQIDGSLITTKHLCEPCVTTNGLDLNSITAAELEELFALRLESARTGIVDSEGRTLRSDAPLPRPIIAAISTIQDGLLQALRQKPTLVYTLSPRAFEELVAQILERLGYEVELTPSTRDGGFDLYAARHDALGKFLFLVECKRLTPPHKVGVQVIRSLLGVVHERRANAGIVVTSSYFTRDALECRTRLEHQMHLKDYLALREWLQHICSPAS